MKFHLRFSSQPPLEEYPDLAGFLDQIREGVIVDDSTKELMFEEGKLLHITRAPGRLDVMGGFSDYSGGLVLQLPIKEACFAAGQMSHNSTLLRVVSRRFDKQETVWSCDVGKIGNCSTYDEAKELFTSDHWVGYIVGCLIVLKMEEYISRIKPVSIFLVSRVPEGSGVSSSASVEVASMKAFSSIFGLDLDDAEIAHLCQRVENCVVGAPCGIMDQMTSAIGQEDSLLVLSCQPDKVLGHMKLPPDLSIVGIDSGERHAITGAEYSTVRAATFMGLKILQECTELGKGLVYLSELDLTALPTLDSVLPDVLTGSQFLKMYGEHIDHATSLDPDREYPVKAATKHPVLEKARVQEFHTLLKGEVTSDVAGRLGELMYSAHEGYCCLQLDSKWTSALVELARTTTDGAIHGCKITGGGSGGSVCLLKTKDSNEESVQKLILSFKEAKGGTDPMVFWRSSPGAQSFGVVCCEPVTIRD